MRRDARLVTVLLGSARLGTQKTPLRLLLRNRGSVFRCYSSCIALIRHSVLYTIMGWFSTYFPYFEKIKLGLCNRHALCVCLCIPSVNFEL
jgi:hypothetical protein